MKAPLPVSKDRRRLRRYPTSGSSQDLNEDENRVVLQDGPIPLPPQPTSARRRQKLQPNIRYKAHHLNPLNSNEEPTARNSAPPHRKPPVQERTSSAHRYKVLAPIAKKPKEHSAPGEASKGPTPAKSKQAAEPASAEDALASFEKQALHQSRAQEEEDERVKAKERRALAEAAKRRKQEKLVFAISISGCGDWHLGHRGAG